MFVFLKEQGFFHSTPETFLWEKIFCRFVSLAFMLRETENESEERFEQI